MKVGDRIRIKIATYWHGTDIGGLKGTIKDTEGHTIVDLDNFKDNPVIVFQYEIEELEAVDKETTSWLKTFGFR